MMSGGDGQPETLSGVTVTLDGEHAMGETMETGMDGGFAFTGLRAGTYTVTISDFPEDVSFETVSVEVEIDVGEVGNADFTGHYIRTSAVEGQVIIDGEGLAGVDVSLIGGPSDESFTTMTDVDGMYRFEDLRPGDYTVSITNPDARDYEFAATSQDVSVDLDETGTVSFTGVLLRTSGISGRVSVEGMGLGDISVTLSGAADASTTTDAGGQYAFAGLAAGDYTVTIAVASDAYVFDAMSMDRTVGDDESAIVNFEGQHARTASVSGQAFLDELDKNNMMDAGEHPLAAAGIPVALVGPGVNDQRLSATGADGSFSFSGLRAGSYQLVVPIDATVAATLAAGDVAYGGPGTGYAFDLGVGESKSQAVPFDITHTTVNFSVSLRSGDEMGDALPGASVSLYGANSAMVGSGTTGDDGNVSIKVARAMTSGNMVMAGVSAEGYDVADGMTAVSWDPQMFATSGANSNDIVNLNVDVSISGATVSTEYGGGEELAGWAIDVMMGDAAVAGAPTMLGDDGSVAFTTTVESVPASFTFTAADDQDDDLDGGEMYEASGGGYTHTGLKVAGAMDADPIVVTYTTQTLKVYVHHERDQVRGFTGNVLDGDKRMSGLVDLEIRHASGNDGRFTSPISNDDWDAKANSSDSRGVYTFAHLPAGMDIVVRANVAMDGYKLLDLERLDTYRNMDENGVMGGAFGAMGGWGHTVALCPLEEIEPTGQDFGDCASFGVVSTHNVSGLVWKLDVSTSGQGFKITDPKRVSGIEVSLDPVEGKNLAGVGREFTTAKSNDPTTPLDERVAFDFGTMAAGAYALGLPDGWRARIPADDDDLGEHSPKGATGSLGNALSPLGDDVALDITPSTATVYGFVRNKAGGFGLENVTVTMNGKTATTDNLGRYIVSGISAVRRQVFVSTERAGFPAAKPDSTSVAFGANTVTQHDITLSGANNTVTITGTVTDSDTGEGIKGVRIKVDNANPLNGLTSGSKKGQLLTDEDGNYTAIIAVKSLDDPTANVTASKTGYHFLPPTFPVPAIAGSGGTANFEGRKGTEIIGRAIGPSGDPMGEVVVTASWTGGGSGAGSDADTTTALLGTFSVIVPVLSGTVTLEAAPRTPATADLSKPGYQELRDAARYVWFEPPANRSDGEVVVFSGQTIQFGDFQGYSVQPRITSVKRVTVTEDVSPTIDTDDPAGDLIKGEPTATIEVTWKYDTRTVYAAGGGAAAAHSASNTDSDATFETKSAIGATPPAFSAPSSGVTAPPAFNFGTTASPVTARVAADDGTTKTSTRKTTYTIPATDSDDYGEIEVRIGNPVIDADGTPRDATLAIDVATLGAVASEVTDLVATRTVKVDANTGVLQHNLTATWKVDGSPQLEQRIALEVEIAEGRREWIVSDATTSNNENFTASGANGTSDPPTLTRATDSNDPEQTGANWGQWMLGDEPFDLNNTANAAFIWHDDDTGVANPGGSAITVEQLKGASRIRIDTKADGGDWVKGPPAAIPSGGGG